ncbi:MAG: hypothetical protein HOL98_18455 [Gammaproteobacteria bacterium]|jgi:hypothetical protein|nr:hypothetical protein [Gammaproteobacteria bacterium]MBT5205450.1 hypothetical protein [Gammaproteobacteria bacterium]MBT5600775.1 hypothetical protein [Gammaproteobacteria bacterium]MBT6243991.1 hypothetical protein [Gammaproteobacteria bacterium]
MKFFYYLVAMLFGAAGLFIAIVYAASELGGEVVTLIKPIADGETRSVRVWIVDRGDQSWIEHGSSGDFWLEKVSRQAELKLIREGRVASYTAVIDAPAHDLYHQLRARKYTVADRVIQTLTGRSDECTSLPVRLMPIH